MTAGPTVDGVTIAEPRSAGIPRQPLQRRLGGDALADSARWASDSVLQFGAAFGVTRHHGAALFVLDDLGFLGHLSAPRGNRHAGG
jgi:hypothetical protein